MVKPIFKCPHCEQELLIFPIRGFDDLRRQCYHCHEFFSINIEIILQKETKLIGNWSQEEDDLIISKWMNNNRHEMNSYEIQKIFLNNGLYRTETQLTGRKSQLRTTFLLKQKLINPNFHINGFCVNCYSDMISKLLLIHTDPNEIIQECPNCKISL